MPFSSALCLLSGGCGGPSGPPRYDLSGTVTYQGKPLPLGYIGFAPDTAKGNDGPGSHATIQDGKYATMPGHGTIGGPHVVTITGFDGAAHGQGLAANRMGRPLFPPTEIEADLPREPATHDFMVPAQPE